MNRDAHTQHLRRQLQQLILLRETGPKSATWHQARTRMIWRLHDEIQHEDTAAIGVVSEAAITPDPLGATESEAQPNTSAC